jgi:hypothetical protein
MKIMIENADNLEYLTAASQWSKNVGDGRVFKATRTALEVAKKEPIARFNIVCYIPETEQFINLDHGRGKGSELVPA